MLRLVDEHVESRRLDRAGLQRRDERRLVDDRAARDVDERALLAERGQHLRVDHVPGRGAAGARHDEEVGIGRERLEIGEIAVRDVLLAAAGVRDLHAHRAHARRDRLADAAEPQDADALARELGRELGPALQPLARVHEAIEAHEAAARHHDEADRDVGDVVGEHVRRVGHLDAALAAVVDRHAVVADAEHRDDLELRQRVEQRRRRRPCRRPARGRGCVAPSAASRPGLWLAW